MSVKLETGDLCTVKGHDKVYTYIRMYPNNNGLAIVSDGDEQYLINISKLLPYTPIDSIKDWEYNDTVLVDDTVTQVEHTYIAPDPRKWCEGFHILINNENGEIRSVVAWSISTIIKTNKKEM